jgi:hypothetical protein
MALAAAAMVPALAVTESLAVARFGTAGFLAQAMTGLAPILMGVAVYGALSLGLAVPEASELLRAARGRRPD